MSRYAYTAKVHPHQSVRGTIEAESKQDAIDKISRMGYFPVSVLPQEIFLAQQDVFSLGGVPRREIVLFTRQLSSLMESGVNILDSLQIILRQTRHKYFKAVIEGLAGRIKDGQPLSESLKAYPRLFSGLYISLVRAGEAGGDIEKALVRLADFLEKEEGFRLSLRQALVYPVFILATSALTVAVLLGFVIPRLAGMFEDMGTALPLPTKILIELSGFLQAWWWLLLAAAAALIFTLRRLLRRPQARLVFDRLKLRLGILGTVILKAQISRFMRTMSLLLSGGIAVVEAADISASVFSNQALAAEAQKFKDQLNKGLSLSACFSSSKLFPPFAASIASIGEETGALERSLLRLADDYEKEVDGIIKTSTRLLEPAIILAMGLVVAFIVLAMLLPIFQINLIAR